jgi:hypothetical protein
VSPALAVLTRHEESGSRAVWLGWLALFGVGEYCALRTKRMAPLTNVARWVAGARCASWHGAPRRWAFGAFLAWLYWHIVIKED